MADTVVGIELQVDANPANTSVKSFKTQLKEATQDVITLSEKFGAASTEAQTAAKKVASLKDAIGDAKQLADTFNPDKKFVAFGGAVQGVASGFAGLQGAMALFGSESKAVEETLLKVQSAMALSQGISGVFAAVDSFKLLGAEAATALKGIKTGIAATGIGLLVVALGTIVAYWDDIIEAVSGVNSETKTLNTLSQQNLETEKEKLKAIGDQDNVLKLQGKTEKEILNIKIAQTDETIAAGEIALQNSVALQAEQIKAAERNQAILAGILKFISLPLMIIGGVVDGIGAIIGKDFGALDKLDALTKKGASFIFDPAKTQDEGAKVIKAQADALDKLKNDRAGYQLQVNGIDKKASDDRVKNSEDEAKRIAEIEAKALAERQKRFDDQLEFNKSIKKGQEETDKENAEKQKEQDKQDSEELAALQKQQADEENAQVNKDLKLTVGAYTAKKKLSKETAEAQMQHLAMVGDALNAVSDLVGRNTVAGKALAVAASIINTYKGVTEALSSSPPPFNFVAAAAVAAAGFAAVKNIIAVQVPGGAGGSVPATPSYDTSAPVAATATTGFTQLDPTALNAIGNATTRAFVVESDVADSQERITRLNRAARL